jgi:hypothetical protein
MTAAVGLGFYKDFSEVEKVIALTGAEFTPNSEYRELFDEGYRSFRFLYKPASNVGNKRVPPVDDRKRFSLRGWGESQVLKLWVRSQMAKAK